jgi:hypothetical protein
MFNVELLSPRALKANQSPIALKKNHPIGQFTLVEEALLYHNFRNLREEHLLTFANTRSQSSDDSDQLEHILEHFSSAC